jgi:hypothetical protein
MILARQPARTTPPPPPPDCSSDNAELVYRELHDPAEIVALLRLRHRIYFEERGYGAPKPMGIDLTAHDSRTRLFGIFRDGALSGGLRLVFRRDQPLAPVVRAVRAVVQDAVAEQHLSTLPSEEAFDLALALGARSELVDVEVGRLAVSRPAIGAGVVLRAMVATLGVIHLERCRLYLYSCAADLAARFARIASPRWLLEESVRDGIQSDGFTFPKRSVAVVAAPEDSPYFEQALIYAREIAQTGSIVLSQTGPFGGAPAPRRTAGAR